MIFKDRKTAALKMAKELRGYKSPAVISLLRGGVVIGKVIADKLKAPHLPLVVAKISALHNEELAIGALCFDTTHLEKSVVEPLRLTKREISSQIRIAHQKFEAYCKRFGITEEKFDKVRGKDIILVDDGVATGSTARAACLFLKQKKAKRVILAVPVAPDDFEKKGFDKFIALHQDPYFSAVSQFYKDFPQVEDNQVKRLLKK